jgi:hypothetical protein
MLSAYRRGGAYITVASAHRRAVRPAWRCSATGLRLTCCVSPGIAPLVKSRRRLVHPAAGTSIQPGHEGGKGRTRVRAASRHTRGERRMLAHLAPPGSTRRGSTESARLSKELPGALRHPAARLVSAWCRAAAGRRGFRDSPRCCRLPASQAVPCWGVRRSGGRGTAGAALGYAAPSSRRAAGRCIGQREPPNSRSMRSR